MINTKTDENFPYFDDKEREMIEQFEKALDDGVLVSRLTPERKSALQANARYTADLERETQTASLVAPAWKREIRANTRFARTFREA
uniref:Uncharacterized protein n=1 Tax=Candidatus Kentrum sp. FM TaxID=2126340 RepID=A0A450SMJ7_9GAMM|nr:MAG: hypothetical protein BECKFM1743A_GA0114220_101075 [Candidatus Kentron sp. FM]VFJ54956.1 MAG: hypothetical protein BECKFM1743C_GA0114222_101485 [Candidatus Kentron sp. FM]VFK09919.1 MAG: hypothetical protein BECKFM1743B_GA0114221_101205 [Candidatus Kentron sp. FM]